MLRMIYFALRDHNWNTINSVIENENISINENDFEITYDCFHIDGGVDVMQWEGKIQGNTDGSILFEIHGRVLENFRKNRAGFCVLHPLTITNQECVIIHPDDSQSTPVFPELVAPENPFKNIKSMAWNASGISFSISFEGDTFETEDQRNWGDASFKTFCTPLDKPFPVELRKGEKVFQRITFKPVSKLQPAKAKPSFISLHDTGVKSIIPALGIGASSEMSALPVTAVPMIRDLNLSHYRIEIYPANENWVTLFSNDYENAYSLGLPLEVALHLTDNYQEETEAFLLLCQQNKVKVKKVLLLQSHGLVTSQRVIDLLPTFRQTLPKVSFGAGTNYNFNEINKNHFKAQDVDFIGFSIDPQEHAFDDLTILENIASQEYLVRSARSIYGHSMPIHISPLTLRKRFNPYATRASDLFIDEALKADPRQKENLAALWTFGSICHLTQAGARSLTYYQTVGNQGIMSEAGEPYPVYSILKSFSSFQCKKASMLESSDSLSVKAILLEDKTLALVNLTEQEKEVRMNDTVLIVKPQEIKFKTLHRT